MLYIFSDLRRDDSAWYGAGNVCRHSVLFLQSILLNYSHFDTFEKKQTSWFGNFFIDCGFKKPTLFEYVK